MGRCPQPRPALPLYAPPASLVSYVTSLVSSDVPDLNAPLCLLCTRLLLVHGSDVRSDVRLLVDRTAGPASAVYGNEGKSTKSGRNHVSRLPGLARLPACLPGSNPCPRPHWMANVAWHVDLLQVQSPRCLHHRGVRVTMHAPAQLPCLLAHACGPRGCRPCLCASARPCSQVRTPKGG